VTTAPRRIRAILAFRKASSGHFREETVKDRSMKPPSMEAVLRVVMKAQGIPKKQREATIKGLTGAFGRVVEELHGEQGKKD
jgi:hypothetical protein